MDTLKLQNRCKGRGHRCLSQAALLLLFGGWASQLAEASPTLIIPQIPLIMASPVHPQVLFAVANSESMDGTLSGAIMTGSGSLSSNLSSLVNSSSPVNYTVPTGFMPPLQAADAFGQAPYTVLAGGRLHDNGPSRLNVAKEGISAIIDAYMQSTDFALATYSTSGVSVYKTWVYHMSPPGDNFSFTNNQLAGKRYITNPCFNYLLASSTVQSNCASIATIYGGPSVLSLNQYMQIGSSSDDPDINDVLYTSGGFPGIFVTFNGPNPVSPYPPSFSLINYNNGGILISYSSSRPSIGGFGTSPTNAGFVPFSQQVMYAQRGFGYYGNQSATSGSLLVPMTTAGDNPTTTTVNNAINLFLPFLKPETNSNATTEIKASAVQAPMAGLLTTANTYLTSLSPTSGNGCPQKKYVILISDGLPTKDLSGKLWPPLGSAASTGYGVSATFNADGSLNSTNNQALTDAVNAIKTLKINGISTYVIGLGAGVDPTVNPQAAATLTAMSNAGGTGNYYPAVNSQSLVNSLDTIMVSIQNGSFSTSAAAVSSTHLNGDTVQYQANFVSNDTPYQDWTGNLFEIALDPVTGIPTNTINWSSQTLLDAKVSGTGWSTARVVATWDPVNGVGVPFRWANLTAPLKALLQPLDLLGTNRVDYLRGNTDLEKRNGGTFRNRSHILGDMMESQVIFVGPPDGPYRSSSYRSFAQSLVGRTPLLYVGANDGMLHAFDADSGAEAFAYIPNGVFSRIIDLTSPLYNQSHQYFVNGSPMVGDVQFSNSSWHTILVGGLNAGGNSIYALDVTNPASYNNESNLAAAALWEFTDSDMGLSYSVPQVAQIGSPSSNPSTFAVFFGNGYNSPSNKSVIYAVNPQTGALIKKIDLCAVVPSACDATYPQGLSSVAVANNDGLQGVPITNVYAGDLQGNLWSINVTNPNPASWTVRLLFKAQDTGGNYQPITTTPVITLNPNYPRRQGLFIMFGTGRLLTGSDLTDSQTQSIYGVWDEPSSLVTYSRTNLQQQTLTFVSAASTGLGYGILTVTSNTINWNSKVGWYNDMLTPGQRLVTNPALISGAFVATLNTPPASTCGIGFTSLLLELNYQTGGAFLRPQFDINGDGAFNAQDKYNGQYAAGIELPNSFSNAPTILGANQESNVVILITQSNGTQTAIINPNNTPRKVGWWQIQR